MAIPTQSTNKKLLQQQQQAVEFGSLKELFSPDLRSELSVGVSKSQQRALSDSDLHPVMFPVCQHNLYKLFPYFIQPMDTLQYFSSSKLFLT